MFNTYKLNEHVYNYSPSSEYKEEHLTGIYHIAVDGAYAPDHLQKNRIYVVGYDSDANPVTGADENTTDIGLVGERLNIAYVPEAQSTTEATSVAEAMLLKERMKYNKGYVVTQWNVAIELWDVVRINDSYCSQTNVDYRVTGIDTIFVTINGRIYQILMLGDV